MKEWVLVPNSKGEECVAMINGKGELHLVPRAQVDQQLQLAGVTDEATADAWLARGGWRIATLEETQKYVKGPVKYVAN